MFVKAEILKNKINPGNSKINHKGKADQTNIIKHAIS